MSDRSPPSFEGPTVSVRLARALATGAIDAAVVGREVEATGADGADTGARLLHRLQGLTGDVPTPSVAPPVASSDPTLPKTVGRYRILDRLGRGGMGVVYGAWDDRLQRPVALKMLRAAAADPDDLARFQREVRIAASLKHPGIVAVHEVGSDGADPFFTMDIVDGVPLDAWCTKQALGRDARVDLVSKVAQAVHHAHTRGVLHRDLKPGNILVREDGQPVILDFGLAKPTAEAESTFNTMTGTAMGTPAYMSPEQAGGRVHEVDTRTDVYALGVILYQLVTGRLPFEGRDPMEICRKVVEEEVPRPSTRGLRLPADLETVILKALEKDPARRYPSALHLDEELRRYLTGEPITARKASILYRIRRRVGRNPVLSGMAAALALAVLGGGAWIVRETSARRKALVEREAAQVQRGEALARQAEALAELRRALESQRLVALARQRAEDVSPPDLVLGTFDEAIALTGDPAAYAAKGEYLIDRQEHSRALPVFDEGLGRAPGDVTLLSMRADCYNALGDPRRRDADYREILRIDPTHWVAARFESERAMSEGRIEEALRLADLACVQRPNNAHLHALRMKAFLLLGRTEEADGVFPALRGRIPDPVRSLHHEITLQVFGRYRDALEVLDRLVEEHYLCVSAHLDRGRVLRRLGRPEEALRAYEEALAIEPGNPVGHSGRGFSLARIGRREEAETDLRRSIEIRRSRGDGEGLRELASVLVDEGFVPLAVEVLPIAMELGADPVRCDAYMANALVRLRRFEEAIVCADRALAIEPDLTGGLGVRGFALAYLGREDEALAAFGRTIDLERAARDGWGLAGTAVPLSMLAGTRYKSLAVEALREALAMGGDPARCREALAGTLLELGRAEESLQVSEEWLRDAPRDPDALWARACVLTAPGRIPAERVPAVREALEVFLSVAPEGDPRVAAARQALAKLPAEPTAR